MSASNTDDGSDDVPHHHYHATKRKAYGSQQEVAEAWADGAFPTHNVGRRGRAELYSSPNFRGFQHPDGTGRLMHYGTREAIRTHNGLIIANQQCWSRGFAHCSPPRDRDATLPLSAIESLSDRRDDVFDIVEVRSDNAYTLAVIDGEDGRYGVVMGRDPSIIDGARNFAFRVDAAGVEVAQQAGVDGLASDLLTPLDVQTSDLPVVNSREYTKSRLSDPELQAHIAAGGKVRDSQSRWRDRKVNPQHFRADLQGEVIVRHGEWFFIPTAWSGDVPEVGMDYAEERLGSHYAAGRHEQRSPLPKSCLDCGAVAGLGADYSVDEAGRTDAALHVDADGEVSCNVCGADVPRNIYVRGEVRHRGGDHNAVNLGETWHRAVTHDRDVMTYSTSGGGGRVGWD